MEELLKRLNEAEVKFVVIGGQAMFQEGMPRFTIDWDFFIPSKDLVNFQRINMAIGDELDMKLEPLDVLSEEGFVQTFQTRYGIIQFHLLTPGLGTFDDVYQRSVSRDYKGIQVKYLCLEDLYASKMAVQRGKDSDDILFLKEKLRRKQSGC